MQDGGEFWGVPERSGGGRGPTGLRPAALCSGVGVLQYFVNGEGRALHTSWALARHGARCFVGVNLI